MILESDEKKNLLIINDRIFKKNDFNDSLLRMIVAFELSFSFLLNIELQKVFYCLNNSIEFSSFFIIKNHLILRYQKIQSQLLRAFSDNNTKVFFL